MPELAVLRPLPLQLRTTSEPSDDDAPIPEETRHILAMTAASERVVMEVRIPEPDAEYDGLERLLGLSVQARVVADSLADPVLQRIHPGPTWAAAENAAQGAYRAYLSALHEWEQVELWQLSLRQIAMRASVAGAWDLLELVADGLRGDVGSIAWWTAVSGIVARWRGRNYLGSRPELPPSAD